MKTNLSASQALVTLLLTVACAAATFALLWALGPHWQDYAPASCLVTRCFCEAPRTGDWLLQPANTLSSFGFVAVGWWVVLNARAPAGRLGDGQGHSQLHLPGISAFQGPGAAWFGVTAIFIGVGSALLHATLTLWGQFFDVMGMYLLGAFILTYALARWLQLAQSTAVLIYAVLCTVLIGTLLGFPDTRRWLFAVLLLAAIALEWGLARPRRPGVRGSLFVAGLLLNMLAFGIWILDNSLRLCSEHSLWQGHAAWHLLGAAAVGCNYLYYRSEKAA